MLNQDHGRPGTDRRFVLGVRCRNHCGRGLFHASFTWTDWVKSLGPRPDRCILTYGGYQPSTWAMMKTLEEYSPGHLHRHLVIHWSLVHAGEPELLQYCRFWEPDERRNYLS